MLASLRSRLWLTYLLLIAVILAVVSLSFFIYLARNPRPAREAQSNLNLAASALQRQRIRVGDASNLEELQAELDQAAELLDVRTLLINPDGSILVDSGGGQAFGDFRLNTIPETGPPGQRPDPPSDVQEYTDENGKLWIFTVRKVQQQPRYRLVTAVERPNAPLIDVFADEFFQPLIQAGFLALALSIILAAWMSRSISAPLQHMSLVAGEIAEGERAQIEPQGPREVQSLARSLNEMSEKVHSSQESQRDFVANVSHELKTPITSIQGFAQAILDGTASSGEALKQAAQVVYDEAGRMRRMVTQLLDLARLEAGTAAFDRQPADLEILLRHVLRSFEPQAHAAEVELQAEIKGLPGIHADGDRLVQVFTNLLENAVKYSRGGQVTLKAWEEAGQIKISVQDSGPGIPPADLDRIFERFYQVDRARSGGPAHGVGLGLSIAQEIVRAHGGRIQVASAPGEGSTFTVSLPVQ